MLDTGLALQIKRAGELLQRDLAALGEVLKRRAFEFRDTVQVGRTHGIHAEPITFGMKLGMWAFEVARDLDRLRRVTDGAAVGKLSGAVGAYNNIDPRVEELVCAELGLGFEPIANQVVQRDRHAAFLSALAIVGSSLEKFAVEVRHLQRTEVREAEEAVRQGPEGLARRCPTSATRSSPSAWPAAPACCAATPSWAWRTWRSGTSATSPTARPSASCSPTRASCSTTCCRRRRSSSTGWWSTRRACWPTSRCRSAWSSAAPCCSPWSTTACCATTPTGWCRTAPCGPGARASTSAS